MPEWNASDPDEARDAWAWMGEHSDPDFYAVAVPFMRWLSGQPAAEVKSMGEAIIVLGEAYERVEAGEDFTIKFGAVTIERRRRD